MSLQKIVLFFCFFGTIVPFFSYAQTPDDQKTTIQQQMDVLQKEIDDLDQKLESSQKEKQTLTRELNISNTEIKKRQLEVKKLSLAIADADREIKQKDGAVYAITTRIEKIRKELSENIATLYRKQSSTILEAFLQYSSLSEFFYSTDSLEIIQAEIKNSLNELKVVKKEEENAKIDLEDFKEEQVSLKSLQELEKRVIERNKKEKDDILKLTKGKEALFQSILSQKKKNLASLKSQLFYIERTGVSAEDALKYAKLAADRAGIRVAFLLALLEVETGRQYENGVITAGTHIGTGNWKADLYDCYIRLGKRSIAENQKADFFKITDELGLDPDKMPVSRRYSNGAGCGGAMGPAQFMPSTWISFKNKTAKLTGNNPPNPWNIEDAFTASAIFLAEAGATAKNEAGETRAARTYISGRSACPAKGLSRTVCLGYSRQITALSKEIARNIN
ncbi:MAG: lytic murein transglycosylase [Patescibacteria group bacterium]